VEILLDSKKYKEILPSYLESALENTNVAMFEKLLVKGGNINLKNGLKQSLLHRCVEFSSLECAEVLLKNTKFVINCKDEDENTALQYALIKSENEIANLILVQLEEAASSFETLG